MSNGRGVIALVLVVAIAAGVGGVLAGRYIESPDEAAASAEPPEASLITVPVELRELSSSVVVRGDVVFSDSADITPVVTGAGVVTRVAPAVGDIIEEGAVLVELEGRPVFVLQGDLPMFRTLGPGLQGADVMQLEEALLRMGYIPGIVDERYDIHTEAALQEFYKDAGYDAVGLTSDEQALLDGELEQVKNAQQLLDDANKQLADAQAPEPYSVRLENQQAQQFAESAVTDAKAARIADNKAAADAVAAAKAAVANASPEELSLAQADLKAAEQSQVATQTSGNASVKQAEDALVLHNARVAEAAAERADVSALQEQVNQAQTGLTDAQSAYDKLDTELGVSVPEAEVIFLDGLPRRVKRVLVERGDQVTGSIMEVSGTEVRVDSSIATVDRPLVNLGDIAIVSDSGLGIEFEAEITFVASSAGGSVANTRYAMTLVPLGEVPEGATDNNLKVTIPFSTSGGEVLAVPLAALSAAGDGTVRVEVEDSPGDTRLVEVVAGLRTGDFVEVTPTSGTLNEGDQVVVGRS